MMTEGSMEILEPSTEFPILYALLTAAAGLDSGKQKVFHATPRSHVSAVNHKNKNDATPETAAEPDSSTRDDPAFPLLLFRLTRPPSTHQPYYQMGRRRPRTSAPIQRYGYGDTKTHPYTDEESEEVPSSTTEDDQSSGSESPHKRTRRSEIFGKRESSEELEMPHLEPMVSTPTVTTELQESCTSSTDVIMERSVSMSPPILLPILDIPLPSRSKSSRKRFRSRSELLTRAPRKHKVLPNNPASASQAFTSSTRQRSEPKGPRDLKRVGCRRTKAPVATASVQSHSGVKSLADLAMESDSDKDLTKEELNFDKKDYLFLPLDIDVVDQEEEEDDSISYHSSYHFSCQSELEVPNSCLSKRKKAVAETRNPILCVQERRSSTEVMRVFPCGHCNQIFDSVTLLVQHASVAHLCGKDNLTVDYKIETEW